MKIAVVTGASSGIGRAIVLELDKHGTWDEIWVVARREGRLSELQTLCRNPVRPLALDLSGIRR